MYRCLMVKSLLTEAMFSEFLIGLLCSVGRVCIGNIASSKLRLVLLHFLLPSLATRLFLRSLAILILLVLFLQKVVCHS